MTEIIAREAMMSIVLGERGHGDGLISILNCKFDRHNSVTTSVESVQALKGFDLAGQCF
jgi:hypothetical protein